MCMGNGGVIMRVAAMGFTVKSEMEIFTGR